MKSIPALTPLFRPPPRTAVYTQRRDTICTALTDWLGSRRGPMFHKILPRYKTDVETMMAIRLIPETDPRIGLRGQHGIFAIKDLPANTVIGIYVGKVYLAEAVPTPEEYARQNDYVFDLRGTYNDVKYDIAIDGEDCSNWVALINAYKTYQQEEPVYAGNCDFIRVHWHGTPYIVAVATTTIKAGAELLMDYGENYWTHHRAHEQARLGTGQENNPIIIKG